MKFLKPGRERPAESGIGFKLLEAVDSNPFVPVMHLKIMEGEKEKTYTFLDLKDSATTLVFGVADTGRYSVLVAREPRFIFRRDMTTAAGSGYMADADQGDPLQTGWRKLAEEAGISEEKAKIIEVIDFNGGVGSWAYPQNVLGAHYYVGVHVEEFPLVPEDKRLFLLDLFPSKEMLRNEELMQQYRLDTQEHEVLWMGIQLVRNHLLMKGLCNQHGVPK
jgi:hypothetical protein